MSNVTGPPLIYDQVPNQTLAQLQDDSYTVIWAPILFATVIALSLVGILVPLWEFLFIGVSSLHRSRYRCVYTYRGGVRVETEISRHV